MATALVPGSFNPIHHGHVRIIETMAATFDRVVVAAVGNPNKDRKSTRLNSSHT